MNKTLKISFALKNTYRVNSILYGLKQIPLVKKILPEKLYGVKGLKVFANVLSALWEVAAAFLGKVLYFIFMVSGTAAMYESLPKDGVFIHILLFLTVIGSFMNTHMFNPTRDKYYAIILMRMDAKSYTLTNYGYMILKVIVGFLACGLFFGISAGVPVWLCVMIPFFAAGLKTAVAASTLRQYEKTGDAYNENRLGKFAWLAVGLLLAAAYGLPALGIVVPEYAAAAVMAAGIIWGALSVKKIVSFSDYHAVNQQLLSQMINQMDQVKTAAKSSSEKMISADTGIKSGKKGFEFLNELFIKRHKKILWKSSIRLTAVCLFLVLGCLLAFYIRPEIKSSANELLMTFLPYFVFIMYAINRGTGFTRALFMNCDHSLLTYSFYKQPKMVLKLFAIRLREIIKINLLPAAVLGGGLAALLYASGGTDNPINYAVIFVSIISMSVFFSVHYLTIYYLLQPYNAGTEMKSGTYQVVLTVTYIVCFAMMRLRVNTLIFGVLCTAFCLAYCGAACLLVYRFAPRTFKLRS